MHDVSCVKQGEVLILIVGREGGGIHIYSNLDKRAASKTVLSWGDKTHIDGGGGALGGLNFIL